MINHSSLWPLVHSIKDPTSFLSTTQTVVSVELTDNNSQLTFFGYLGNNGTVEQRPYQFGFQATSYSSQLGVFAVLVPARNDDDDFDTVHDDGSDHVDAGFKSTETFIVLRAYSAIDEMIFGFGVTYTHVNLKGRVLPIITSEQGIGEREDDVEFSILIGAKFELCHYINPYIHTSMRPYIHTSIFKAAGLSL